MCDGIVTGTPPIINFTWCLRALYDYNAACREIPFPSPYRI